MTLKPSANGNVRADDEGAAQVAEKNPLDEKNQDASEHKIVQNSGRRHVHQIGAIVKRHQFHSRRQRTVGVDFLNFIPDAGNHVVGMQGAVHHHDRRHHVVFVVAAGLAKSGNVTDRDLGNVLDVNRDAVGLTQDDILDVFDVVTLRQVSGPAAVHQADAANVDGLLADVDGAAADIDVGVADRRDHLGKRHVVGVELMQIDIDVVRLGCPAPGVDLNDAGDRQQAALDDPVLDRSQIGQSEVWGTDDLIAIDLPDQAGGLDLRRDVVRKTDILLQVDRGLRQRKIVINAVVERHPDKREPVKRSRPDNVDPGRGSKADFNGNGEIPFHFFG